MIRLKELFDRVYNWQDASKFSEQKIFTFETENAENYFVMFDLKRFNYYYIHLKDEHLSTFEEFVEKTGKTLKDELYEISFKKYFGNNVYGTFDIHKTDNAIKVFSTILDIIEYNIKPNESFCFFAKEPSRIKLYDHFAKKFKRANDNFLRINISGNSMYYFFIPQAK